MKSWYVHVVPVALILGVFFGYYVCSAIGFALEAGISLWLWINDNNPPVF